MLCTVSLVNMNEVNKWLTRNTVISFVIAIYPISHYSTHKTNVLQLEECGHSAKSVQVSLFDSPSLDQSLHLLNKHILDRRLVRLALQLARHGS